MPSTVSPSEVEGSTAAKEPKNRKLVELMRPEKDPDRHIEVSDEINEEPLLFFPKKTYPEPGTVSSRFEGGRW